MSARSRSAGAFDGQTLHPIRFFIQFTLSMFKYLATLLAGYLSLLG